MQLTLLNLVPPNQPPEVSIPTQVPTAWDGIDEASRLTALAILARLIAQMLVANREKAALDD